MSESNTTEARTEVKRIPSVDGTNIAVERRGEGPPLVLVHGTSVDRRFWGAENVWDRLAAHHTVYAYDRRGYGDSDHAEDFSISTEVEDLLTVVDSVGEPVHLLGHSYGALLSYEAAPEIEELGSLCLFEPPLVDEEGKQELVQEGMVLLDLIADGEEETALLTFWEDAATLSQEVIEQLASTHLYDEWVERFEQAVPPRFNSLAELEFNPARAREITAPTLLMGGTESGDMFEEALDALEQALPSCNRVAFEDHCHAANVTAPAEFADAVLAFIEEIIESSE